VFAIEFNEVTLPKILQIHGMTVKEAQGLTDVFLKKDYVIVSGYYNDRTPLSDWEILPKYVFTETFDFNPEKIKTDWDQIVRL
jgi:hypothetical protein